MLGAIPIKRGLGKWERPIIIRILDSSWKISTEFFRFFQEIVDKIYMLYRHALFREIISSLGRGLGTGGKYFANCLLYWEFEVGLTAH